MKTFVIVFMLFCSTCLQAQNFEVNGVNSLPLCISPSKTTSVVFPNAIRHVDIGTGDVLVQQVKDAGNILLVKAARRNFPETNLSVVSADGKIYSFRVQYDSLPSQWIFDVQDRQTAINAAGDVRFGNELLSPSALSFYLHGVLFKNGNTKVSHDHSWGVDAMLDGIFVKDEVLFFRVTCNNTSSIDYAVDDFRFLIKDVVKMKRTAIQQRELDIVSPSVTPALIKAGSKTTFSVAIQKFTIPPGKYMAIEMREKSGGRNLELRISNRQLTKAEVLKL